MDNKYTYTYEITADYCYKGTDVLINKLVLQIMRIYLLTKENLYL